jgi:hypothetical protein
MDNGTRRFSWDGLSFRVPQHWDMAGYERRRGGSLVRMGDETSGRLEMGWVRPRTPVDLEAVERRAARASPGSDGAAAESEPIRGLPARWAGVQYAMPDGRALGVAFHGSPDGRLFCGFRVHGSGETQDDPARIVRGIADSFRHYPSGLAPWEFYDVGFRLDAEYRLARTALQAGMKLLVFERRLRRLFVWHVSLADLILRRGPLGDWAAAFLNRFRGLRGPRFFVRPDGALASRRSMRYPLGHYEEIGRACFRYHADCRHLADRNQVALWVLHHRTDADVEHFGRSFALDVPEPPDGQRAIP